MAILLIFIIILVSQFVPVLNFCIFGQPTLECKLCICHPECHCETKCVQQQILKECNLGVDNHNALASHHTQENRTTRIILIVFLSINLLQTLLFLFRNTVRNCYRTHQAKKQQRKDKKQQASVRYQTERYTDALKHIIITRPEHPPLSQHSGQDHSITSNQSILSFISTSPPEDKK